MPSGGVRAGAGRKNGSRTRMTRAIAERIAKEGGLQPLEVMDLAMNYFLKANPPRFDLASGIAKDMAPFMHPRLQAVEHSGPDGGPVEIVHTGVLAEADKNI